MRHALSIAAMLLVALFPAGCDRGQESKAPRGGGGASAPLLNYENEAKMLKSLINEDPGNLNALIRLGNLSMDANRFQDAIEAYGKALELDPKNVNVRVDMGTCYRRSGRPDKAAEEYRKAIEQNPGHFYAHMNLGVVLAYDFGKREEAIKEFELAIKADPAHPNVQSIKQEIERLKAGG
jgi:tetratricopeptide (TPR) repeat protein